MEVNGTAKMRQPIVVIVGHVDHGKTTLLDYIRKSNIAGRAASGEGEPRSIAEREAGGITQAVGAYEIDHNGKAITFIDTPGHEAFITMRSRGATIADLAVLVVAADEGVKPQTKESIKILEETKTPFIVAINKIDKPGADLEKTKNDLMTAGVYLEGFGGQVSFQPISAKTGEGVGELLDLILLVAEVEGLTYDPESPAEGFVLEGELTNQRGISVTLILKEGTLREGDMIATATTQGKVKILETFLGKATKSLHAGQPAIVVGFESLPKAGELCVAGKKAVEGLAPTEKTLPQRNKYGPDKKTLNIILKAADAGSLEAISAIVHAMDHENPIVVVDESVGELNEGDVKHAVSTGSSIIGFKTKVDKQMQTLAQTQNVTVITSDIIYELVKVIQEFLQRLTSPLPLAELEVLAVFNQTKLEKQLVGGKVLSGTLKMKMPCSIKRGEVMVAQGTIVSLQEGKKDATQVVAGKECGLIVSTQQKIEVGDHILILSI